MLASERGERFRLLCRARPAVVIVDEYNDRAQSPAGFDQPSLRRLLRASASATVIGRATHRDSYALPTAPAVLLRRLPATVETCLVRRIPSMEAIATATLGRPLLISAPKRGGA